MKTPMINICDKCGIEVPPNNDAVAIDLALGSIAAVFARSRHLIPTDSCTGSPSRAQYIEGQPRDARGYGYDLAYEDVIRDIYAEMQKF